LNDRLAASNTSNTTRVDRSDPNKPYASSPRTASAPLYIGPSAHRRLKRSSAERRSGKAPKLLGVPGNTGKGDGEKAAGLRDDLGFRSSRGSYRRSVQVGSGLKRHFRTMTTGLSGTPMPSYRDAIAGGTMLGAVVLRAVAIGIQGSAHR